MIKDGYTVLELVKAAKVSRQAYYKWLKRELTTKDIQDQEILNLIKEIEKTNKQSIGYGKMTRLIKRAGLGYLVNKKRVIRIMKEHGIKADYRQAKRKRDKERQTYQAENILNRQFKQEAANQVWVTDTTELAYNIHNYKVRLHVPWVRLKSIIRCIPQTVRSTGQNLVNNEGTFPFGLELVLFLIRQA